jgi:hypothetical protein
MDNNIRRRDEENKRFRDSNALLVDGYAMTGQEVSMEMINGIAKCPCSIAECFPTAVSGSIKGTERNRPV